MSCCGHNRDTSRFFGRFAARWRRRYQKKGLEKTQKQLLEGLQKVGFQGASVLEIGSGVGYFHQQMLALGAKSATGVDLSSALLDQAKAMAQDKHVEARTRYVQGDFVELASQIEPADVTVLDKVVCCYPDAAGLMREALAHTGRTIALTYPRDHWLNRLGSKVMATAFGLFRSQFRNYVHDPKQLEGWVSQAGFSKRFETTTAIWLTQVYSR